MPVKTFSRRQFLMGLGGSLLPMPFLSSLASKAQAEIVGNNRLNFVSVRSIYGQVPQLYYPPDRLTNQVGTNIYHRAFSNNERISTIIGDSFRPVSHKLSLLRGIDNSWGGHNHSTMLAPSNYNKDTKGDPELGTSMDELLSRSSLYNAIPAQRILRVEPYRKNWGYSWYKGTRQPYDNDMNALRNKLFGSGNGSDNGATVDADLLQSLKAVDIAKPGYDSLRRSAKMSQVDKDRLGDYFDMLSDLEGKLESIRALASCAPPEIDTSTKDAEHDAAIDLTIAALVCGMTKVASLSMATWGSEPGENGADFHNPSHWEYKTSLKVDSAGGPDYLIAPRGSSTEQKYVRMYSYVSDKVGSLMSKMDQIVESNGKTLLDNSIVYWGNEMSGSSSHGYNSVPILIGGTANGRFTPGYWDYTHKTHLFYAGRTDSRVPVGTVPYTNFLVTLLQTLGLERSEYESYNEGAGFGHFRLQRYSYTGDGPSLKAAQIYQDYVGSDTNKRKTVPIWYS